MCVITFLRDIDIAYSIPIILNAVCAILWSIIGFLKFREHYISKSKIKIIYDKKYNGYEDIITSQTWTNGKIDNKNYTNYFCYRICIINRTYQTLHKVTVFVSDEGVHGLYARCAAQYEGITPTPQNIKPKSSILFNIYCSIEPSFKSKEKELYVKIKSSSFSTVTTKITL